MKYISTRCNFSKSKLYRYSLKRAWATDSNNQVLFIGLNPSTADSQFDDPTIRRCVKFAICWGFNSLEVVNLFAFRATDPIDLFNEESPIGRYNDDWIKRAHNRSKLTVACWGSAGMYKGRSSKVAKYLENLFCIRKNKDNSPAHPLYLNSKLSPIPFNQR